MFTIPCWQAEEAVVGVPGLVRQQGHHAGHKHTAQQGDEDEGLKGKGDDDNDVGDGYYDYNNMLDYNDEEDNDDYNDDDSDDDNSNTFLIITSSHISSRIWLVSSLNTISPLFFFFAVK